MVYFDTSDEWQRQSSLLLQARPTTARVSTKYKIPNLEERKYTQPRKRARKSEAENEKDAATANGEDNSTPKVPRAVLVLKTYDPASGVCLKFKTDRAAEVGRLFAGLGRLGRHMAALPVQVEDIMMDDAPPSKVGENAAATTATSLNSAVLEPKVSQTTGAGNGGSGGTGGGAGKKKKKNKK